MSEGDDMTSSPATYSAVYKNERKPVQRDGTAQYSFTRKRGRLAQSFTFVGRERAEQERSKMMGEEQS